MLPRTRRALTMYRLTRTAIIAVTLSVSTLLLVSCGDSNHEPVTSVVSKKKVRFEKDLLQAAIEGEFVKPNSESSICLPQFRYFDTLRYYYSSQDFDSQWDKQIRKHSLLVEITDILSDSYKHGLDTGWYHLSLLRLFADSSNSMLQRGDTIDYRFLAQTDILLSHALLAYSIHLQKGAFDPRLIFPEDYLLPMHELDSSNYFGVFSVRNLEKYFNTLPPHEKRYTDLQEALARYRNYAEVGDWDSIPFNYEVRPKINPGDTSYILSKVAARLKRTAMLDTSYYPDSTQVYDTTLAGAVRRFQVVHGIYPDGVIGKRTVRELNMSVDDRIRQLEINLERFRWMRYPEEGKYVMVNLAAFMFYSFKDGIPVDTMKICAGKARPANYAERMEMYLETGKNRPMNMETPCMHSKYSYVVLNPRWHIPKSIAHNEIIWSVLKDSTYLQEEHIKVYLGRELLDPDTIDWRSYIGKEMPFMFKQDPGTFNSLGIIKFIFWNKFSIFQHDTPHKRAFNLYNRAVSHGCMRLEQPLELARFLLEDEEKWPMDRVLINLGLPPEEEGDTALERRYREILEERELLIADKQMLPSTRIHLETKVELFVDYFTAWVDGNGDLQFRPDVYRKDDIVAPWYDSYVHAHWPQKVEAPVPVTKIE